MWFFGRNPEKIGRPGKGQRGHAVVETGLLLPWLVISFIGVFDAGTACYGLISIQSAARAGAMWGAISAANADNVTNLTAQACLYALDELRYAPNVGTSTTTCSPTGPVYVTAQTSTGLGNLKLVTVSVRYTIPLIPIPGLISGNRRITRTVQLPVRN